MNNQRTNKFLSIPKKFSGDDYYRFFKINLIIKNIILKKKLKKVIIIDVGCGNGYLMKYIKENNDKIKFTFIGIDKYIKEKVFNFRMINQDIEKRIDLPNCFADIIICAEIIEHIKNTDGFINEVGRLLKKRGDVIVSTPNLASYFNRFLLLFGYQPYHSEVSNIESGFGLAIVYKLLGRSMFGNKTAGHLRMFTLRALRDFIEFHGFKIEKYFPVYFTSFRKDNNRKIVIKTFFALDKFISLLFPSLASGLIIHLKKYE